MSRAKEQGVTLNVLLTAGLFAAWTGAMPSGAAAQSPASNLPPAATTTRAAGTNEVGSLDLGASPSAPTPPPPVATNQPGSLDMDVNPNQAPAPATASIPPASRDRVVDGITPIPVPSVSNAGASPPAATPATPAAEPLSLDHPTVIDTAKLKSGDTTVILLGIEGLQGEPAQGLQGFIAAGDGHVTCQAESNAGFVCLLSDGTDVAEVALVNGAARVKDDAPPAYREQEAGAQAARRGIWANLPPPPVTVPHPAVSNTATITSDSKTYKLEGLVGFGAPYADQLKSYIAANGDSLSCQPQMVVDHYICMLGDGTDIAKVALVNGAARVADDAPDSYRVQQGDALANHRGYWLHPPPQTVVAMATVARPPPICCALPPGDDGVDGVTYVGGMPEAMIDGEAVFLIYGGAVGWGYYDHWHHWHGAPDRFRHHLDRFHPAGHGLRGSGGNEGFRHEAALHSNMPRGAPMGERAGFNPGMHPGMQGGFVHPGPSPGGFHPGGGMAAAHAAPAVHASSSGGGRKH